MHVACRRPIKIDLLVSPVRINGCRRFDDFDVETTSKWLEMREDEFAGRLDMGCGEYLGELRDAKCDKNAYDAGVVAKVQIKVLVYREGDGVVVKGNVDLSGG